MSRLGKNKPTLRYLECTLCMTSLYRVHPVAYLNYSIMFIVPSNTTHEVCNIQINLLLSLHVSTIILVIIR
jgi:hypothetical protein